MSGALGLRPILVNKYEVIADKLLAELAQENGDRLLTKVGLADVIEVSGEHWDEKRFALAAHLDFLMVDSETSQPRFAVELDGATHWNDPDTRRRDRLKDSLCKRAYLPLLRISSRLVARNDRRRILKYVIEAFYLSEAFYDMQASGGIPDDEPFIVTSTIVRDSKNRLVFNALDSDARLDLLQLKNDGLLPSFAPDEYTVRDEGSGGVQTYALMAVATDRYLVARSEVRDFRFQGILPGELASQLAVADLAHMAQQWIAGEPVACNGQRVVKHVRDLQAAIDAGGFISSATGGALAAGGPLPDGATVHIRNIGGRRIRP